VLAVDVAGLRQILTATGPVQAAGVTVDADNVEQYVMHDQYEGVSDNSAGNASRSDALGAIADAVLRQLQGQSTDLRTLASAVAGAVTGRHLMVWSSDPKTQAAWMASGAGGAVSSDSLAVAVVNRGGNKLDQYLSVSVGLTTRPSGRNTEVTMTSTLVNRTPPGQSQFIAGPYPGLPLAYGEYSGVVADNLPAVARSISMTGGQGLIALGAEGPTWLAASPVVVDQGATATVVVRFRMPGQHGSMTLLPSARIPAEQWTYKGVTVSDEQPVTFRW